MKRKNINFESSDFISHEQEKPIPSISNNHSFSISMSTGSVLDSFVLGSEVHDFGYAMGWAAFTQAQKNLRDINNRINSDNKKPRA